MDPTGVVDPLIPKWFPPLRVKVTLPMLFNDSTLVAPEARVKLQKPLLAANSWTMN